MIEYSCDNIASVARTHSKSYLKSYKINQLPFRVSFSKGCDKSAKESAAMPMLIKYSMSISFSSASISRSMHIIVLHKSLYMQRHKRFEGSRYELERCF